MALIFYLPKNVRITPGDFYQGITVSTYNRYQKQHTRKLRDIVIAKKNTIEMHKEIHMTL